MDSLMPTTEELSGLWKAQYQGPQRPDDALAKKRKLGVEDVPIHGTYNKICYHRVYAYAAPSGTDSENEVTNAILVIFDDDGNFGHFVWDSGLKWGNGKDQVGAWKYSDKAIEYVVAAENPFVPLGARTSLRPTLTLTPFNETDERFPRSLIGSDCGAWPLPYKERADPPPAPPKVRDAAPPDPDDPRFIRDPPRRSFDGSDYRDRLIEREPAIPYQYVYYKKLVKGGRELVWKLPGSHSLVFEKQVPALRQKASPGHQTWIGTFETWSPLWDFPLLGWYPAKLGDVVYSRISTSGTDKTPYTLKYSLHGRPIFLAPGPESEDFIVDQINHKLFLALGTITHYTPGEIGSSSSQMLSTIAERVNSWSLSLGLSAGVEKILSGSAKGTYHEKITEQRESERRYSVNKRMHTRYVLLQDVPNLYLDPKYREDVLERLKEFNFDPQNGPDWKSFVDRYGTHYAHAIVFGAADFVESRCSLRGETEAWEKGLKLETQLKGSLDGIKLGLETATDSTWGGKVGKKAMFEFAKFVSAGAPDSPVPLALDLRPAWELFSPVFFPPNLSEYQMSDDPEVVAPFIWRELRASFRKYLEEEMGVGQSMDPSLSKSYLPIIVKARPNLKPHWSRFPIDSNAWIVVEWKPLGGTSLMRGSNIGLDDESENLSGTFEWATDIIAVCFPGGHEVSDTSSALETLEEGLSCLMAMTPKMVEKGAGFEFTIRIYLKKEDKHPFSVGGTSVQFNTLQGREGDVLEVVCAPNPLFNPTISLELKEGTLGGLKEGTRDLDLHSDVDLPIIVKIRPELNFGPHYAKGDRLMIGIGWAPVGGTKFIRWSNTCLPVKQGKDVPLPAAPNWSAIVANYEPYTVVDPTKPLGDTDKNGDFLFCEMAMTPEMVKEGAGFKLMYMFSINDKGPFTVEAGVLFKDYRGGDTLVEFSAGSLLSRITMEVKRGTITAQMGAAV